MLNVQAGCQFCDAAFQKEVASGRLSSGSLDTYACVALAGVATEWLRFGHAEGGLADVQQLDRLLQALRFTQARRLLGPLCSLGPSASALALLQPAGLHIAAACPMRRPKPMRRCAGLCSMS